MTAAWVRRLQAGELPAVDFTGYLYPDGYRALTPRPPHPDLAGLGADSRDADAATEAPDGSNDDPYALHRSAWVDDNGMRQEPSAPRTSVTSIDRVPAPAAG